MAHVKLRPERFKAETQYLGFRTQQEEAEAIGVHGSIHSRALAGHRKISAPYALGVLCLVGGDQVKELIEDLFAFVDAPDDSDDDHRAEMMRIAKASARARRVHR
ncbi:hypothetical protein [Microtetraspora malaysiensis]|uniref:Uncharacterized protein n=1 Tax=Microtetraspora malaysiensis TaxID=161358 RepID=A0ABW6SM99_9ACTN